MNREFLPAMPAPALPKKPPCPPCWICGILESLTIRGCGASHTRPQPCEGASCNYRAARAAF